MNEEPKPLCSCSTARVGDVVDYGAEVVHHVRYPDDCYVTTLTSEGSEHR